jgi:hypothetical protein
MTNARVSKKVNKNNFDDMPYGYRSKVVEMLADKGITVTPSQIFDIKRGRTNFTDLTVPVLNALKKVQRDHRKELRKLKKLRTA